MIINIKTFFLVLFIGLTIWSCEEESEEQSKDCAGIIDGNSVEDNCGNCDDDASNDCEQDCAGIWGGENICGCTDSTSYNYNSNATFDDGSCDTSIIMSTFNKDVEPENSCSCFLDTKQTTDGGYIIAGCNNDNAWLMKTDPYGEKEWEQTYDLGDYWGNRTVIQTSDGGYIWAGWEGVLKTDANGTQEWKKEGVPGTGQNPYYEDVMEHSNGNFYLVGGGPVTDRNNTGKGGQAIMVKMSPSGSVLKTKFYGGQCEDDLFRSIIESNDGKLIMVGEKGHGNGVYPCSFNFEYYKDIWVIKTGKNGAVIWEETYGGDWLEKGMDIVRKESGGYMVVGQRCKHKATLSDCNSKTKAVILDIDEEGNKLDETTLPGLYHFEAGTQMALENTHSGGYVFATTPFGNKDIWLYKWGDGEETMNLKLFLDQGIGAESIHRTKDDGFIISTWPCLIIKTDSDLSF